MYFDDKVVSGFRISSAEDFAQLITEYLCGNCFDNLNMKIKTFFEDIIKKSEKKYQRKISNHSKTNEINNLLSTMHVGEAFSEIFFGKKSKTIAKIKNRIKSGYHLSNSEDLARLITECLCMEREGGSCGETTFFIEQILHQSRTRGLNYEQFNELLLLLNQDRIGEAFFRFFFEKEYVKILGIKKGIAKFRGYAMLCFGNFRFAYRSLINMDEESLRKKCSMAHGNEKNFVKSMKSRPNKALEINRISRENTWFVGYLAPQLFDKEASYLTSEKSLEEKGLPQKTYDKIVQHYSRIEKSKLETKEKAITNTQIYLAWDYMDIYIATSMRKKWEFEDTYDFIDKLFKQDRLKNLNLRWFDPTQSLCVNRIDKGLVEGLMLKRSDCTIYMAQEYDTMGKDSELAATLAQGKPVIAYVPKIHTGNYVSKIERYTLNFFSEKFFTYQAKNLFSDENLWKELNKKVPRFENIIDQFLRKYEDFRKKSPFTLWIKGQDIFKQKNRDLFTKACKILAIAEQFSLDTRADLLMNKHPLSLQVILNTGVANGVLVVRDVNSCAEILQKILSHSLRFTIEHIREKGSGITILREEISGCAFRVVTDNENLTNSFWNFYLEQD